MTFWDEGRVQFYIDTWGPPTNPTQWEGLNRMEIPVALLKGESALDVGCGLGHLYYALKGKVTTYMGIDASTHMLEKAREYFPEADFREGNVYDLSNLPLFDTVYSVSLLIHLYTIKEPINQLWSRTKQRCVLLIPLGKIEEIENPEQGLIYHQISFSRLDEILQPLPDVDKIEKIHWSKNHYFIVLDRKAGT
jgi:2-polyprenyl-3-methyl-5-hydroxy-6-metoxy-1,4-benzoquinol methylase